MRGRTWRNDIEGLYVVITMYLVGRDGSASTSGLFRYCSTDGNSLTWWDFIHTSIRLTDSWCGRVIPN